MGRGEPLVAVTNTVTLSVTRSYYYGDGLRVKKVELRRNLKRAGFGRVKVWLNTPAQHRRESLPFKLARHVAFHWPPFRWFFEREVFAVAVKV